jgi:hypothetical protein
MGEETLVEAKRLEERSNKEIKKIDRFKSFNPRELLIEEET